MKNSLKKNNQGMALIVVVMSMLVLSILSVAVLSMTATNLNTGLEERDFQSVYYISEGGADYYTEEVKSTLLESANRTYKPDVFFNDIESGRLDMPVTKSYELFNIQYGAQPEVEMTFKKKGVHVPGSESRTYIVEAKAIVDGVVRKVEKPIVIEWQDRLNWKYKYAAFTYGDMNVAGGKIAGSAYSKANMNLTNGGIEIDGDIYAEGDITTTSSVIIGGDVYALGDVTLGDQAHVHGNVYAGGTVYSKAKIEGSVYALDSIKVTQNSIYIKGDAHAVNTVENTNTDDINDTVRGNIFENETDLELKNFPLAPGKDVAGNYPDFPEFPNTADANDIGDKTYPYGTHTLLLPGTKTYRKNLTVTGGTNLTIKYSDGDILMVDKLDVNGDSKVYLECIDASGEGTLSLYVKDKMQLASCPFNDISPSINMNNKTEAEKKEIIKKTSNKLAVYGYGSGANKIAVTGGQGKLYTQILHAPEAIIPLAGDGNVTGPVIATDTQLQGSHASFIDYNPSADDADKYYDDIDDVNKLVNIKPVREK